VDVFLFSLLICNSILGDAKLATDVMNELINNADLYFDLAPPPVTTPSPSNPSINVRAPFPF
jgi:hypothetical protein